MPGEQQRRRLPASVAAELKHFACLKMSSAETMAIHKICDIIPTAFSSDNTETPAVWATLWTISLVYRQAMQMALGNPVAFKNGFREVTGRLFDSLIVALHDHFRTRKVLEALNQMYQPSFQGYQEVIAAYKQAQRESSIFCEYSKMAAVSHRKIVELTSCIDAQVQDRKHHGDDLVLALIVEHEKAVKNRKRQRGGKQGASIELVM